MADGNGDANNVPAPVVNANVNQNGNADEDDDLPEVDGRSMYFHSKPMLMEGEIDGATYRPVPDRSTLLSHAAKVIEMCNALPKFGGCEGEKVEVFIKAVDTCMVNMNMTSGEAATALFSPSSPLYGRAATFANYARTDSDLYPHARC